MNRMLENWRFVNVDCQEKTKTQSKSSAEKSYQYWSKTFYRSGHITQIKSKLTKPYFARQVKH